MISNEPVTLSLSLFRQDRLSRLFLSSSERMVEESDLELLQETQIRWSLDRYEVNAS